MLTYFKIIYKGLKNIIQYAPLIYKDRDWDYSFYEKLMLFKLKRMYKSLLKSHVMSDFNNDRTQSLKALKICITILKRRKNDFYFGLFSDYIDQKLIFIKVDLGYQLSPDYRISSDEKNYYKCKSNARAIEKRDFELYHKLLLQYSEYWWS
jgi:hypothetical protein